MRIHRKYLYPPVDIQWERELHRTTSFAIKAIAWLPKKSVYRTLIYRLIAEDLDPRTDPTNYMRLKNRLMKFWGKEFTK